jgi:hypothetical protein
MNELFDRLSRSEIETRNEYDDEQKMIGLMVSSPLPSPSSFSGYFHYAMTATERKWKKWYDDHIHFRWIYWNHCQTVPTLVYVSFCLVFFPSFDHVGSVVVGNGMPPWVS